MIWHLRYVATLAPVYDQPDQRVASKNAQVAMPGMVGCHEEDDCSRFFWRILPELRVQPSLGDAVKTEKGFLSPSSSWISNCLTFASCVCTERRFMRRDFIFSYLLFVGRLIYVNIFHGFCLLHAQVISSVIHYSVRLKLPFQQGKPQFRILRRKRQYVNF